MATADDWNQLARDVLSRYDEPLLRLVAGRLFKPRIGQPVEELAEKAADTLGNAPVIDRRIRDLPDSARALLALVGVSRQPRWAVGHLVTLHAALGPAEGFVPVQTLLESGLLFPELPADGPPVRDFTEWLGRSGTLTAKVFTVPAVAARAREWESGRGGGGEENQIVLSPRLPLSHSPTLAARQADGLEWPLRLAAVWQQVRAAPIRLTQADTLFKRDLTRLQADELLAAPPHEAAAVVPAAGLLALEWAAAAGLLADRDHERHAEPFPDRWDAGLWPVLADLVAAFWAVETWDPLAGYRLPEAGVSTTPTAGLLALVLMAADPDGWLAPADLAGWLWEHHPSWPGAIPRDHQRTQGAAWVEAFLLGVAFPLRAVEAAPADGGWRFRLTPFGRHLVAGGPLPAEPPAFPQTLVVQPNAEVLAYRQGLTPGLVGKLSRFARWKGIGPACTLELTADETYRGLESGFHLGEVTRTLDRHAARAVPANVADLLRRWADKRERITVYTSATLVEFATPADLDAAVNRGIVSVRLTDRVGLTDDGREPDFRNLRLIGNRDYESKPQRCVLVEDDGLTLSVDAAQSDLLLEAEISRLADPLPADVPAVRLYRMSADTVRRAAAHGMTADDLDGWFLARTGEPLSAAARLFLLGPTLPPPTAASKLVVRLPTAATADGVMQWPVTRELVEDRLGPTAVVVPEANFEAFRAALAGVGVNVE